MAENTLNEVFAVTLVPEIELNSLPDHLVAKGLEGFVVDLDLATVLLVGVVGLEPLDQKAHLVLVLEPVNLGVPPVGHNPNEAVAGALDWMLVPPFDLEALVDTL